MTDNNDTESDSEDESTAAESEANYEDSDIDETTGILPTDVVFGGEPGESCLVFEDVSAAMFSEVVEDDEKAPAARPMPKCPRHGEMTPFTAVILFKGSEYYVGDERTLLTCPACIHKAIYPSRLLRGLLCEAFKAWDDGDITTNVFTHLHEVEGGAINSRDDQPRAFVLPYGTDIDNTDYTTTPPASHFINRWL